MMPAGSTRFAAAFAAVVLSAAPAPAVLFDSTADPNFNTTAPTGLLAGSGWQYEGTFGGFLATPIAPKSFIAAKHIGGTIGSTLVYNGVTYTTDSFVDSPNSDLRIWHITGTFPTYAPLNTRTDVAGRDLVVFGRGNERGANITLNGNLIGWGWNTTGQNLQRWGTNTVTSRMNLGASYGTALYATFDHGATATEATLSAGDSSGGVFIKDPTGGVWKLAGINFGTDGPFATDASGTGAFSAALFDMRGYYAQDPGGTYNFVSGSTPVPSGLFATEIASNLPFILSNIVLPSGPPGNPSNAVRDVNGDGISDLVFQNSIGQVYAWFLNGSGSAVNFTTGAGLKGTGAAGSGYLYAGALGDWRIVSVADVNGDGIPDLIFQNSVGQVYAWFLNGSGSAENFTTGAGLKGTGAAGSGYLYTGALGDWRVH